MRKRITFELIPLFLIFISCGSGLTNLKSSEFKTIDSTFSGTFKSLSFKANDGYGTSDNKNILDIFEVENKDVDSININFTSNDSLVVSFSDSTGIQSKKFKGKFKKKGYYQVYLKRKNIKIPPIFPIIYNDTDIKGFKIVSNSDNDLVIENFYARSGFLLILGSGYHNDIVYYFEQIK